MAHNLNGRDEIHYYKGSNEVLEATIDGNPDLTQGTHVLEFYLARWYENVPVLIEKTLDDGITGFADGRYEIEIGSDVDDLGIDVPYRYTVWYTPDGGRRDVTARGVFRAIGTVDGS